MRPKARNRGEWTLRQASALVVLAMEMDELRSRLAVILTVEEREPTNWLEVERLASELQQELPIDATPEAVHRYLDDADIRSRDDAYGHVRGKRCAGMSISENMTAAPRSRGGDARWFFLPAQASSSGCCYSQVNVRNWHKRTHERDSNPLNASIARSARSDSVRAKISLP